LIDRQYCVRLFPAMGSGEKAELDFVLVFAGNLVYTYLL
jgi:hypothetical protein